MPSATTLCEKKRKMMILAKRNENSDPILQRPDPTARGQPGSFLLSMVLGGGLGHSDGNLSMPGA